MTTTSAGNPMAQRSRDAVTAAAEPCDYCTKPIVWTINTNTDNPMPLDAEPDPTGGNIVVITGAGPDRLLSNVIGSARQRKAMAAAGHDLHMHHRLSCPYGNEWSRPNGPKRGSYAARLGPSKPAARGGRGGRGGRWGNS